MKHFMIWTPTYFYAMDFYGKTKRGALDNFKRWAHIDRMPKGSLIWEK